MGVLLEYGKDTPATSSSLRGKFQKGCNIFNFSLSFFTRSDIQVLIVVNKTRDLKSTAVHEVCWVVENNST